MAAVLKGLKTAGSCDFSETRKGQTKSQVSLRTYDIRVRDTVPFKGRAA